MPIRVKILNHPKSKKGAFDGQLQPIPGVEPTPQEIWEGVSTAADVLSGARLDRWEALCHGVEFQGTAAEIGPKLKDGDQLFLYVKAIH